MTQAYSVFHLNLAFSSIEAESRPDVIARCYHPLLNLVEAGFPLGVEMTGWTLLQIADLDPDWVQRFTGLLEAGRCELIGSGRAQIIGPLVPHSVNEWNQRLGLEIYERVLGIRPRIALVNEMAFSSSLVDLYADAGYSGFIMDRDNVRLALGIEDRPLGATPTHALGPGGSTLPVLWSDSILFQKLQHYAHGDIRESDYLSYASSRIGDAEPLLPVYMNDAEVFDYRPGRFGSESRLHTDGEWQRVSRVFSAIIGLGAEWVLPRMALDSIAPGEGTPLTSASHPVPVKKQAKYNLARWAITGRNDMWLNTLCHRLERHLVENDDSDPCHWADLVDLWATDLRTHITESRWAQARLDLDRAAQQLGLSLDDDRSSAKTGESVVEGSPFRISRDPEGILMDVGTDDLQLVLNLRRGLTIQSLGFGSHGFEPVLGTLPHGFFGEIELGADFYSGGIIVEIPGEKRRITDLEWVEPTIEIVDEMLRIAVELETPLGSVMKTLTIPADGERLVLGYEFPDWERPLGTIRAGIVTLLPDGFSGPLSFSCANGGLVPERFDLDRVVDHRVPTSGLISSTAGLGATDGRIVIGDEERQVALTWDPAAGAVFPMLQHRPATPDAFTRVKFSLLEMDDTTRPGGLVGSFSLTVGSTS
jgi:hypothetical protein